MTLPADVSKSPQGDSRHAAPVRGVVVFLGLLFVALTLVWASGAPGCGFGSYDDEPSHLASALMVRDWLAAGCPTPAPEFAKEYYVHYPKVALGQWPPLLPAFLGAWMLAVGTSSWAILSFFALLSALLGLVVQRTLAPRVGTPLSLTAAAVVLLLPLVQELSHTTMTELPLALLCTGAAVAFGTWLDTGRARSVLLFGLLALLAILVKGSALALALVPPIAIALTRRWDVLRGQMLWLTAAIVGLGALPWYVLTIDISLSTWRGGLSPQLWYTRDAVGYYGLGLLGLGGWILAALALLGTVRGLQRNADRGLWASLAGCTIGLLLFYVLIPTGLEMRHLVPLAPAWVMLAARGAAELPQLVPRLGGVRLAAPALLVLGLVPWIAFVHKDRHGALDAAIACLAEPWIHRGAVLVASDPKGEGTFVTSIALGERLRPGATVLRASKLLGSSNWLGDDYVPRFDTPQELGAWLDEIPVSAVVFDSSTPADKWFAHHDLVRSYFAESPEGWTLVGSFDNVRGGRPHERSLDLWIRHLAEPELRFDLTFDLVSGRSLGHLRGL